MKKYEAAYSGYVYEKPGNNWTPDSVMKERLVKVDLKDIESTEKGGMPVLFDGKSVYIDTGDSHTAVNAISGMKKSITLFLPLIHILASSKKPENMLITDPKGELYKRSSGFLKQHGYKVKCIDCRSLDKDGFNILDYPARIYRSGDKDKGFMLINNLINVLADKQRNNSRCDPFWPDTASMYCAATAAIMLESYADDAINIANWAEFNNDSAAEKLKELLHQIPDEITNTALLNLHSVLSEPEKTLMSTISTAASFFTPFIQNNKLVRMLSHSTINLEDFCREKTALYLITDDTTTTYDPIIGIIISQIQSYIVEEAYKKPNGALDIRMNFVLDEFTSFPIPNMENALATHRSRNIRYYLCVQSIAGLRKSYENFEALLANCGTSFFLGSTEIELLDRTVNQLGKTQITADGSEKPLISVEELMTLKKSWYEKEAIYMNLSESIRCFTTLPSIEVYKFDEYPAPEYLIEHPDVTRYSIRKFMSDLYINKARLPFSKYSDYDETDDDNDDNDNDDTSNDYETSHEYRKKGNLNFENDDCDLESEEMTQLQLELEKKFEELFGSIDDDDD